MDHTELSLPERFQLIVLGLCLISVISLVAKRLNFFMISSEEIERKVSFSHLLGALSVWMFIQVILAPLAFLVFFRFSFFTGNQTFQEMADALSVEESSWMAIGSIWLAFLGVLLYLKCLKKEVQRSVWGTNGYKASFLNHLKNYLIGFSTWLLSFPYVVVAGQLVAILILYFGIQGIRGEQVAVQQLKLTTSSKPLLISMMVTIIGIVPVLEELLFRGFLQTWLREKLSRWVAIPIASLLFATVHFSKDQGIDNLELIVSLFVLSCFLGYLFERQRSLWASIGLHSGFNMMSAFMIIWKDS